MYFRCMIKMKIINRIFAQMWVVLHRLIKQCWIWGCQVFTYRTCIGRISRVKDPILLLWFCRTLHPGHSRGEHILMSNAVMRKWEMMLSSLTQKRRTSRLWMAHISSTFFMEHLFAPIGRFSVDGAPTNIKVKKPCMWKKQEMGFGCEYDRKQPSSNFGWKRYRYICTEEE